MCCSLETVTVWSLCHARAETSEYAVFCTLDDLELAEWFQLTLRQSIQLLTVHKHDTLLTFDAISVKNMNLRLSIREALLVKPQLQLAACSTDKISDVASSLL